MAGFDKIASKKATTTKKSSVNVTANVSDDVSDAVDDFIAAKAQIKSLQADLVENEQIIIDHVMPQQDKLARKGEYTKSLRVPGNGENAVTYTRSDKFSVPQEDEDISEIKKLVGKKFNAFFKTERVVSVKSGVLSDEKKTQKLINACEKAGLDIGEYFDVTDKLQTVKGLDEKQYQLSKDKLETFRTLVKQAKPALK